MTVLVIVVVVADADHLFAGRVFSYACPSRSYTVRTYLYRLIILYL